MIQNIERSKYPQPRKIQAHTIPVILAGRDLKGHAETGAGKTAAFLLPIIHMINKYPRKTEILPKPAPFAIIIEPTREVCMQVCEQGEKLSDGKL